MIKIASLLLAGTLITGLAACSSASPGASKVQVCETHALNWVEQHVNTPNHFPVAAREYGKSSVTYKAIVAGGRYQKKTKAGVVVLVPGKELKRKIDAACAA